MEVGDRVQIYQMPLTQEKPEGMAELLYCEDEMDGVYDGCLVQRWRVQFEDDPPGEDYSRVILTTLDPSVLP